MSEVIICNHDKLEVITLPMAYLKDEVAKLRKSYNDKYIGIRHPTVCFRNFCKTSDKHF
jgi:hypothetical protein